MEDLDDSEKSVAGVKKDGIRFVMLQFYSIYLPSLCKKLKLNTALPRKLFFKHLREMSEFIFYRKLKGESVSTLGKSLIFKYTHKLVFSWIVLYPVILVPKSIFKPFKNVLVSAIYNLFVR